MDEDLKKEQKELEERHKQTVLDWFVKNGPCSYKKLTNIFIGTTKQPLMWAILELAEEGRLVQDENGLWVARP